MLLLTTFLGAAVSASALTPRQIFADASESVVTIITFDSSDSPLMTGSGVYLGEDAVVTNCHVLNGANKAVISHNQKMSVATSLIGHREDEDICILKTDIDLRPVSIGQSSLSQIGDRVYAIGAPRGLPLTLSDGLISGKLKLPIGEMLQITAPISPGSSGGGLFNENGRLIGITTLYLKDSQQINFAVPAEWVIEVLKNRADEPLSSLSADGAAAENLSDNEDSTAAPRLLEIDRVETGYSIDAQNEVTSKSEVFEPNDTIHLALTNAGGAAGEVTLTWTYQDDQVVDIQSSVIEPGYRTDFQISKPDGWPVGIYHAKISYSNRELKSLDICVQNKYMKCSQRYSRLYSYTDANGVRNFSSKAPPSAQNVRVSTVAYWVLEER
jgi:hypothetical protein